MQQAIYTQGKGRAVVRRVELIFSYYTAVGIAGEACEVFGTETKLQYVQDVLDAMQREDLVNDVSYIDVSNIVNVFFGYLGRYRVILGGGTNLRPSTLRHNLGGLENNIAYIESNFPNTTGDLNFSDGSGDPRFTPSS